MINNFIKKKIVEIDVIDLDMIKRGTEIEYYQRTMYEDFDEEWSWSCVGKGEIINVYEDGINFYADRFEFDLSVHDLQDGFHKIEII